jgi:hypothetical protein
LDAKQVVAQVLVPDVFVQRVDIPLNFGGSQACGVAMFPLASQVIDACVNRFTRGRDLSWDYHG